MHHTHRRREFLGALLAAPAETPKVKALLFDVFGTVVDWRGSIVAEGAEWGKAKGLKVDWGKFADRWRAGYGPIMNKVRNGVLPWQKLDSLHRILLDELLVESKIDNLTEAEKQHWNFVWHRLKPWPDSVAGLAKLRKKYITGTLSNGNVSLLLEMGKNAGLGWDVILSAELFGHFKTDPEVYLGAAAMLGYKPEDVMLVAAHTGDLRAAAKCGFKTGFVQRPLEHGPGGKADLGDGKPFDMEAKDFVELADKMV